MRCEFRWTRDNRGSPVFEATFGNQSVRWAGQPAAIRARVCHETVVRTVRDIVGPESLAAMLAELEAGPQ